MTCFFFCASGLRVDCEMMLLPVRQRKKFRLWWQHWSEGNRHHEKQGEALLFCEQPETELYTVHCDDV